MMVSMNDLIEEADFQTKIEQLAHARGWLIHHDRRQDLSIGGDAGFPDLVMARNGVIIIAELKKQKGQLSPNQSKWYAALTGIDPAPGNVEVFVWRPSDWPQIEKILT